ncbi:MAG: glutamine-hydrolyzing carbamoyl-phosphate synthase small subunit [Candidatus Nanohaloarchaea archaeon]|nr:glutamine-hydrolyzing carbamoyl-phosphate synthase small subunit [Candidatus Nanohaloarchaea archaeon]
MSSDAVIGLDDGTVLEGTCFGSETVTTGELVFATPYTGYEEALTDPSYAGQLLMFTYPLIGNYGVRPDVFQSDGMTADAAVVRELCRHPSHHSAERDLDTFLQEEGKIGIEGVDTRTLTTKLRDEGVMNAAIVPGGTPGEAVERARNADDITERDLVEQVSCDDPYRLDGGGDRVVIVDTGLKRNIVESTAARGHDVVVVPGDADPSTVRGFDPDALLFGNGPGDPKRCEETLDLIDTFAGETPILGICLGIQLISLALGGDTYKLPFGHRGANQPVKHTETKEVHITSQNHGFAVDPDSLQDTSLEVTEINPNDGTVEAVESDYLDIHAVQYHPEAYPGPRDTEPRFFDRIEQVIENADT